MLTENKIFPNLLLEREIQFNTIDWNKKLSDVSKKIGKLKKMMMMIGNHTHQWMHLTEGKSLIQSFPFSISWIEMNDKKESNPKLPASKKETMMIHLVKLLKIWKDSKIWYPEMNEVAWRKEFKPKLCFCSPTDWDKWRKIQSFPSPIRMTEMNEEKSKASFFLANKLRWRKKRV